MKQSTEIKWILFNGLMTVVVFGLMTRLQFKDPLDIQLHDTYLVIANWHLLILLGMTLTAVHLMTLGLKKLAETNKFLKITVTSTTAILAVGFLAFLVMIMIDYATIAASSPILPGLGIILLLAGLTFMFFMRTSEMLKN